MVVCSPLNAKRLQANSQDLSPLDRSGQLKSKNVQYSLGRDKNIKLCSGPLKKLFSMAKTLPATLGFFVSSTNGLCSESLSGNPCEQVCCASEVMEAT